MRKIIPEESDCIGFVQLSIDWNRDEDERKRDNYIRNNRQGLIWYKIFIQL